MQINPIISAIIPTKNRCITLKRAIESVLMQSYSNIEIIIINDNSNDETDQLISNYLELENVHYIKIKEPSSILAVSNFIHTDSFVKISIFNTFKE